MKILEELWNGNVEPAECTTPLKAYDKLLELTCRNEEKLQASLTDEQKDRFDRYLECVQEQQAMTECMVFQSGFKLGARIMLEDMGE